MFGKKALSSEYFPTKIPFTSDLRLEIRWNFFEICKSENLVWIFFDVFLPARFIEYSRQSHFVFAGCCNTSMFIFPVSNVISSDLCDGFAKAHLFSGVTFADILYLTSRSKIFEDSEISMLIFRRNFLPTVHRHSSSLTPKCSFQVCAFVHVDLLLHSRLFFPPPLPHLPDSPSRQESGSTVMKFFQFPVVRKK